MVLDMQTVYMMTAVLVLVLHGSVAYSLASSHSRLVSLWGLSGALTAAGLATLATQDLLPGWVLALAAQVLLALGNWFRQYTLHALGAAVSPRWRWGQGLFHLAYLALAAWCLQAGAGEATLLLVLYVFYACNAWDYFRVGQHLQERLDSSGAVLVQGGGLVLMLAMGLKALALWTGWGVGSLYGWGWDQGVALGGLILGMALLNIGFLQILLDQIHDERDRVEHALYLQRERVALAQQQSMDLATLLREREEIIRQLTLSNKTAGMGALVASFAHELNQPLTATLLHSELIQAHLKRAVQASQPPDAGMLQMVAGAVVGDSQRAGDIIRKLRNLFRLSTGAFERIEFAELVRDMLDIVRTRADRIGVVIDARLEPRLTLMGDATQLQQVILNLLNNAIEAMEANVGQVRRLIVRTRKAGDAVELQVEDTGKGIAPAMREEIFSLFKTTRQQGMGVGLWLSRSIVETHRGTLEFASEPGQGAVFTLCLPTHGSESH